MLKDNRRGLIYLTDASGLWVLHLTPATDVQAEQRYARYIRYYR